MFENQKNHLIDKENMNYQHETRVFKIEQNELNEEEVMIHRHDVSRKLPQKKSRQILVDYKKDVNGIKERKKALVTHHQTAKKIGYLIRLKLMSFEDLQAEYNRMEQEVYNAIKYYNANYRKWGWKKYQEGEDKHGNAVYAYPLRRKQANKVKKAQAKLLALIDLSHEINRPLKSEVIFPLPLETVKEKHFYKIQ